MDGVMRTLKKTDGPVTAVPPRKQAAIALGNPARVGRQSATYDDRLFDQVFRRERLRVRWKPSSTNAPLVFDLSGLKQPMKECAGGRPRGILIALADFPDVVKQVARFVCHRCVYH
jgi:hypothetical protein